MKSLSFVILTLAVLGAVLAGCAVYPDGTVVISPPGHHHGHDDRDHDDDDHDDDDD